MQIMFAETMREADREAAEKGIPTLRLMDRAGELTAQVALRMMEEQGLKHAVAICGTGNNGGDGIAAVRHLKRRGAEALAVLLRPAESLTGDPAAVLSQARQEGLEFTVVDGLDAMKHALHSKREPCLLIDALFGTGFHPPAREPLAAILEELASISCWMPTLSIDLPSGVDADTGALKGPAVSAQRTLTLGAIKPALFIHPAAGHAGKVMLGEIGHPWELMGNFLDAYDEGARLLAGGMAREILAVHGSRPRDSHKGTYGHLLVVAGSRNMPGAALLAVRGGLRGGAGLVTLAAPAEVCARLSLSLPEALLLPLPDRDGVLAPESAEEIVAAARGKQALVIGPGLTAGQDIAGLVSDVLMGTDVPVVLDADGLNALGGDPSILRDREGHTILTPHPGELARLTGVSTDEVQADRLQAAERFGDSCGEIIVLKGAGTLIAAPEHLWVNSTGNPGMASGGMGDVLAGLIGSFLAQGYERLAAAGLGVYLHGLAGDLAAAELGPWGFTASEVADRIPAAVAAVLDGHEDIETI